MKRVLSLVLLSAILVPVACKAGAPAAQPSPSPSAAALATDDEKTFYTLGVMVGGRLGSLKLSQPEIDKVMLGFQDAISGRPPQVPVDTYGPKIDALLRGKAAAGAQVQKDKDKTFGDQAAKEPGAVATPSGLIFKSLKPGTGRTPSATSTVTVNYEGKLTEGTVFDSSYQRNQPATFRLNQVIPCWTEALQRMKVGEKARLVCPSSIAYGDQGQPPTIPPGASLVFEVELLDAKDVPAAAGPAAPPAPRK
jgi:FKBP-type peptidyl-prolyl cis-trans isomerase FkpA